MEQVLDKTVLIELTDHNILQVAPFLVGTTNAVTKELEAEGLSVGVER